MTIEDNKNGRKLRKQVQGTVLNIHYTNIEISINRNGGARGQVVNVVPLRFLYPGFKPCWSNFIFQRLKDQWNMPAILSTELWLNIERNATDIYLYCHNSVAFQPPFNHHSGEWKVIFHPVNVCRSSFHFTSILN